MGRIKYQEAIGLEVKRGRPAVGPAPSKQDLFKLYIKEERSVRDVALAMGCSKDAIHRALKQYRIEARTNASRSKLRSIGLEVLEAGVRKHGIRGYARILQVNEGTLRHHFKVRRGKRWASLKKS